MEFIPYSSEELIRELDKMVPHKCPSLEDTMESIQRYAGKRDLVDFLMVKLEFTIKERLKESPHVSIS